VNRSLHIALTLRAPALGVYMPPGLCLTVNTIDLGDRPLGIPFVVDAYLHNLSCVFTKTQLHVAFDDELFQVTEDPAVEFELSPYEVRDVTYRFTPLKVTECSAKICFVVLVGDMDRAATRNLHVRSVFDVDRLPPMKAVLGKWKYGCQAAFAWRGDIDALLPGAGQDQRGTEHSRLLMMRYQIPSTLFVSGRLCLDHTEWLQFMKHYDYRFVDGDLNRFVQYLRNSFSFEYELEYPVKRTPTPIELGNHMYLHYYNVASACSDNNWSEGAVPGQFRYSWERSSAKDSLTEQRDNCMRNQEIIGENLGFLPRAYAAPYNRCDRYTAEAIEGAGIRVSSGAWWPSPRNSLARWWKYIPFLGSTVDSLQTIRDPYHPPRCKQLLECGFVEGDPRSYADLLRLTVILRAIIKRRQHIVLLTHHHLHSHLGNAGLTYFESFLRSLLLSAASAVWITSLSALADWWERVNCPYHRQISVHLDVDRTEVIVRNKSRYLNGIPVIVKFAGNKFSGFLVRCGETSSSRIELSAN